jgi:uncharacterized protein YndB with AHSA1/START domain
MSVRKDESGRRSIQVEVEVPGTPEEVWQAIATGPGVSSWFVPTESDERTGGKITAHFGPGMDSVAEITAWDPQHRFAAESDGLGPGAPPMATEWIVEARDGGTCIVRVVHSLFAGNDDWDNQLESIESGWPAFFRVLRLYLTDFRGLPSSGFQVMGKARSADKPAAWSELLTSLGLAGLTTGQQWHTPSGVPPLAGSLDQAAEGDDPYQLLRVEEPAPGTVLLTACGMGDQVFVTLCFYLYGDRASDAVSRNQPSWEEWTNQHFPMG